MEFVEALQAMEGMDVGDVFAISVLLCGFVIGCIEVFAGWRQR